jgi:tetratricopeptide (TPR) repeat protein
MIHLLLLVSIQGACVYPRAPAQESRESRRALAAACRRQIAANPADIAAYRVLGYALLDSPAEAVSVYEAALRVAPDDWELQYNAGLALRQVGRMREAVRALRRAAMLDTARAPASLVQAGLAAQELGRHDEALSLFRDALERDDQQGSTWGYMARSLYALGKHREAVDAWDRAEGLTPHGFIDEAGDRALYERSRVLAGRRR